LHRLQRSHWLQRLQQPDATDDDALPVNGPVPHAPAMALRDTGRYDFSPLGTYHAPEPRSWVALFIKLGFVIGVWQGPLSTPEYP
jgi:hypothetical protein